MRISDGSSDVCSSDLRRGHVGEGVLARDDLLGKAEDTRPVIPRLFAHPLVVEADDVRVRAVINREGDALALALIEQRGELQDVADSGPAKTIQALVVVPHAAQIALFARQQRSEEHTSELQSLMRISYAVFCLKKK